MTEKVSKTGSWFKNQRINITTDLLVYDDLAQNTPFDVFYSMITTGVEVEKKRKDSFYIEYEKSPKLLITSNFIVQGTGGSSDRRRRYEFEVANHYNDEYTPEDEFGNRFFGRDWPMEEWNKFFKFMMDCVQLYLEEGLVKADEINLSKTKIASRTHPGFYEFAHKNVQTNTWHDQRNFVETFSKTFSCDISSHKITKWLKHYAKNLNGVIDQKSTGGKYEFKINVDETKKQSTGGRL